VGGCCKAVYRNKCDKYNKGGNMKKWRYVYLFVVLMLTSGCTTFGGISQTDKPGTYYILTNKSTPFGIHTGGLICTSNERNGGHLDCKPVTVDY